MPQLQINQGPQDALLYDNSRSYFTNVGYVRTSNFQVEYRDVDPQSAAQFGGTVNFVIPKAADLLGPVDLVIDIPSPRHESCDFCYTSFPGSKLQRLVALLGGLAASTHQPNAREVSPESVIHGRGVPNGRYCWGCRHLHG